MFYDYLRCHVEALLFAAGEPLSKKRIADISRGERSFFSLHRVMVLISGIPCRAINSNPSYKN